MQLINLYGNDGLRLFNMIVFGPMAIGGPMVAVCGLVYISYLLGPWALMGMLAFLLFYPVQVFSNLLSFTSTRKLISFFFFFGF